MAVDVVGALARARQELLDLSLRNPLLNYRPTRRTSVRITGPELDEIWQDLVVDARSLSFLAQDEVTGGRPDGAAADAPARASDKAAGPQAVAEPDGGQGRPGLDQPEPDPADDVREPGAARERRRFSLHTDLESSALQTNLLRVYQAARSATEEKGVNLLFLAVGFVDWRRADDAQRAPAAPLLLVPVEIGRSSVGSRFRLAALDEETVLNPCLAELLARDHHIELPPLNGDLEVQDVHALFDRVAELIAPLDGWSVRRDAVLGFFSFTKYLMYVDLDERRWPEGRAPSNRPLIRRMLGDEAAGAPADSQTPSERELDDLLDIREAYQVLDADASQLRAIVTAKQGHSFVIFGPPGTGKSQTITNIVTECLSTGKTVLFVSEKMAALEVVKRRLDRVGLGDFCLELHSTKARRRAVVDELGRVLSKGPYAARSGETLAEELLGVRERLRRYVLDLHEPVGRTGVTPYQAIGRCVRQSAVPDVFTDIEGACGWDRGEVLEQRRLVERLATRLQGVWPVESNPWRGTRLLRVTAQVRSTLASALRLVTEALEQVRSAGATAAGVLQAEPAGTVGDAGDLLKMARLLGRKPNVSIDLVRDTGWDEQRDDILGLLGLLKAQGQARAALANRYDADVASGIDWTVFAARWRRRDAGALRLLRPSYWADRKTLKACRLPGHRPGRQETLEDVEELAGFTSVRRAAADREDLGRRYLAGLWRGAETDGAEAGALVEWVLDVRTLVEASRLTWEAVEAAMADPGRAAEAAGPLEEAVRTWDRQWGELGEMLDFSEDEGFGRRLSDVPLDALRGRFEEMSARHEDLRAWTLFQDALQGLADSPVEGFVRSVLSAGVEPADCVPAFEKQWHRLLLEEAFETRPSLRAFSGRTHEADRRSFAELDEAWIRETRLRLHALLSERRPSTGIVGNGHLAGSSQLGILQGEIRRKRGGRPIRKLLADTGDLVQDLKPCFMMSPLSVAQFLEAGTLSFDVVVFDEASQVEPADALGAITRGSQLLLVGDPKQLPPTDFFRDMSEGPDAEDEDAAASLTTMESILDRGLMVMPHVSLRWHYRSRHESLIAFSNAEFYENELVIFPSAHRKRSDLGVHLVYEPGDMYDRGGSGTNRAQARRVAEAVFEHARRHPDKSLGVGAFSQRQQQAILDEVELLRRNDESLESFFSTDEEEPFFVKNLETIQGDERDVILLSVGYGKSERAERLSMNFGPVNREGGWRRLNVLVTRAREKCVVFTSIRSDDFDLGATGSRGAHALHRFLHYAEHGQDPGAAGHDEGEESGFEQAVHARLAEHGVELHRQVGCARYAIDLAVVDPENPGTYLLGLECDGATYHTTPTARDRDRLRQQVLQGLGWNLHRVWSTDWYHTPQRELQRALDAVEQARTRPAGQLPPAQTPEDPSGRLRPVQRGQESAGFPEYQLYEPKRRQDPDAFFRSAAQLRREVVACVGVEGPIHEDELIRRIAAAWDISRCGARVRRTGQEAAAACEAAGTIRRRGRFLWSRDMEEVRPRRRGGDAPKDPRLICREELAAAAVRVLAEQYGMVHDDLVRQTAYGLGFGSVGSRVAAAIQAAVSGAVADGTIVEGADGRLHARTERQ